MPQFLYYSPYCYKSVWYEGRIWSNFVLYTKRGNRGDKIRGFGCRHTLLTVLLNFTQNFWLRHVNIHFGFLSLTHHFFLSYLLFCQYVFRILKLFSHTQRNKNDFTIYQITARLLIDKNRFLSLNMTL